MSIEEMIASLSDRGCVVSYNPHKDCKHSVDSLIVMYRKHQKERGVELFRMTSEEKIQANIRDTLWEVRYFHHTTRKVEVALASTLRACLEYALGEPDGNIFGRT